MAAKKRKRSAKKNPAKRKKRTHKRKPRAAASNPRKRASRKRARRATANPRKGRKRGRKRSHRANPRVAAANPRRRRRSKRSNPRRGRKRSHRRNPGIPVWAMALCGTALAVVSFVAVSAGSFAITQRIGEKGSLEDLTRNKVIGSVALGLGGLALAVFAPSVALLGAGLAAGAVIASAGAPLSFALGKVIDAPLPGQKVGAVFGPGGRQQFGAVFDANRGVQQFGAVYGNGMQQFEGAYGYDEDFGG